VYLCCMKVEIENLQTIKNFALQAKVTPSYIYKMVKEDKMDTVVIDGVQFIDTTKFPTIPTKKK
jgi:predicted ATP-dependent serine protease